MAFENLTENNISLFQMKSYETPTCLMSEYQEDIKHIKYLKRLLNKYGSKKTENIERLILNHIIILANVFGVESCVRILFFHTNLNNYSLLKTFLLYLSYLPDIVWGVNGNDIITKLIVTDHNLLKKLKEI
jgi:hypothetical protein